MVNLPISMQPFAPSIFLEIVGEWRLGRLRAMLTCITLLLTPPPTGAVTFDIVYS